ncbi:E3 ubiquitin-protein ligase RNF4-like [Urocitellus parryii]
MGMKPKLWNEGFQMFACSGEEMERGYLCKKASEQLSCGIQLILHKCELIQCYYLEAVVEERKHRGGTVSSRQAQNRTREAASTPEISLEVEPIELVETAGDEIMDLTCESLEPVVVDLTHNDSIEIVDQRRRPRRNTRRLRQDHANICMVGSDDEELSRDRDVYGTTHTPRNTRDEGATGLRPSGTVSCPIGMDRYSEMVQNGRLIVSTECGHVFCRQCLLDSLKNANTCPTCRKKINHKRCHPIYFYFYFF